MKAILLAAGVGKRLNQFISNAPKCLIKFNGISVIKRLVNDLTAFGVTDIVIVVGYEKEKLFDELRDLQKTVNIKYVINEEYKKGSIISLWKARCELNDDVVIMDADVICEKSLLGKLIVSPKKSCFLMDADFIDTGEEQKLGVVNDRVLTITKGELNGSFDLVGEAVGFLKLSKKDAMLLADKLSDDVKNGIDNCEHEEVYDRMLNDCNVGYETVNGLPWIEIDFPEDVQKAENLIIPKLTT